MPDDVAGYLSAASTNLGSAASSLACSVTYASRLLHGRGAARRGRGQRYYRRLIDGEGGREQIRPPARGRLSPPGVAADNRQQSDDDGDRPDDVALPRCNRFARVRDRVREGVLFQLVAFLTLHGSTSINNQRKRDSAPVQRERFLPAFAKATARQPSRAFMSEGWLASRSSRHECSASEGWCARPTFALRATASLGPEPPRGLPSRPPSLLLLFASYGGQVAGLPAEAREASEGWCARQDSNLRPPV